MGLLASLNDARGARRMPQSLKVLGPFIIAVLAKRRRAKGYYDYQTLAMFRYVWLQTNSISALLDYVLFRCDLGFPLQPRWESTFNAEMKRLNFFRQQRVKLLLAELSVNSPSEFEQSFHQSDELFDLYQRQDVSRREFKEQMVQDSKLGLCVVGNSGRLLNSGLGELIDQHQQVIRFNNFQNSKSSASDIGMKIDIWMVSPIYSAPAPEVKWIIVSGPDMLFHRRNWNKFRQLNSNKTRVLTVPLIIWQSLVKQLKAPPSAGILFLAWLKILLGSWDNVFVVGFSYSYSSVIPYHHANSRHKAVERHNWEAEYNLIQQWKLEGLQLK